MWRAISLTAFTLLLLGLIYPSSEKTFPSAERRELMEEIERELGRYEFVKRENKVDDKKEDSNDENTKVLDDKKRKKRNWPKEKVPYAFDSSLEKIQRECVMTGWGQDYFGKKNVSKSGKTCLSWTTTYQSVSMEEDTNYCRNPDYSSKPWCYVQGETGPVKEYCDIPSCADSPCFPNPCKNRGQCTVKGTSFSCSCLHGFSGNICEIQGTGLVEEECKRSRIGYDYTGKVNVTQSGEFCQAWSSQTPHSHSHTSLPENYCRNPDAEQAPWCYTTDPNKPWGLCKISDCVTPPLQCLSTNDPQGKKYFGTMTVTKEEDPCQRWDSQTPHKHRFGALADQDNYCRNPDGEKFPWCYTTNPRNRWGYCAIPHC